MQGRGLDREVASTEGSATLGIHHHFLTKASLPNSSPGMGGSSSSVPIVPVTDRSSVAPSASPAIKDVAKDELPYILT